MLNKFVDVSLVGMGGYPPDNMPDYRVYRIEYGGHGKECITESSIYLPKSLNPEVIEKLLSGIKNG